jgi:flavorubredoxin
MKEVFMKNIQNVTEDILAIGSNDRRLAKFENFIPIPNGVSYNSYVILDEKTVALDTADSAVSGQFTENLLAALGGRTLDYLVVQHMEPDHTANILDILDRFPDVTIISSKQAFIMLGQFFPQTSGAKHIEVKEGDTLATGKHTLHFVCAPMVHWPEVIFSYDDYSKILFSADAFGTFGTVDGSIFADEHDFEEEYLDESRRYYSNIVGKYGMQVQAVLKKAATLDIQTICPLHGPVFRKDLAYILDKYDKWSSYTPETDDILLVYSTLYGHTASAAEAAAFQLRAKTGHKVFVYDASETDTSYLISEVWRCSKIVLFCPTYNNGIYPAMLTFLDDMAALCVQGRTFALAENGTWAPVTVKLMTAKLSCLKNVKIVETTLTIRSALSDKDADKLDTFTSAVAGA